MEGETNRGVPEVADITESLLGRAMLATSSGKFISTSMFHTRIGCFKNEITKSYPLERILELHLVDKKVKIN